MFQAAGGELLVGHPGAAAALLRQAGQTRPLADFTHAELAKVLFRM